MEAINPKGSNMKTLASKILESVSKPKKESFKNFFESFNYDDYKKYINDILELKNTDKEKFYPTLLVYQYMVQDEKHIKMFRNISVREGGSAKYAAPNLKQYFDKEFGGNIQDYFRSVVWQYFSKNVDWEAVVSCYSAYFNDYNKEEK